MVHTGGRIQDFSSGGAKLPDIINYMGRDLQYRRSGNFHRFSSAPLSDEIKKLEYFST